MIETVIPEIAKRWQHDVELESSAEAIELQPASPRKTQFTLLCFQQWNEGDGSKYALSGNRHHMPVISYARLCVLVKRTNGWINYITYVDFN